MLSAGQMDTLLEAQRCVDSAHTIRDIQTGAASRIQGNVTCGSKQHWVVTKSVACAHLDAGILHYAGAPIIIKGCCCCCHVQVLQARQTC